MKYFTLIFLIVIVSCSSIQSQNYDLIIAKVNLIDGTGAALQKNINVFIAGNKIVKIDTSDIDLSGENIINGTGKFLIPGFIDLHVHFPPDNSFHQPILSRLLEFGVTTILNPGARPGAGVKLRNKIKSGELIGPRMFTAGSIIEIVRSTEDINDWAVAVSSEEEIRNEIRKQQNEDVDFIKIYSGLSPQLVSAAIDEAKRHGLPVIGHLGKTTWKEASLLGINMLVHSGWSTPMDEIVNLKDPQSATDFDWYHAYADAPNGITFDSMVKALVDNDVVVVPTLSIHQASTFGKDAKLLPLFRTELAPEADALGWWGEDWRTSHPQYDSDSEEEARLLEEVYFPGILGIVRAYSERGVRLGVGTDVGNPWITPGYVFHHELQLYQKAGIPPIEIIKMATLNGAEALSIIKDTGTIEVGKFADMILLDKNPLESISNTLSINKVFKNGKVQKKLK